MGTFTSSQTIQGCQNTTFSYPLHIYMLLLSCIFIPYIFESHKTSLLLFYKVDIHLYVLTLLYFICSSFFPKSPSFLLRSFSFSLKNTLQAGNSQITLGHIGNYGTRESINDHETLNQLLAFLREGKISFKRFLFLFVSVSLTNLI